MDDAEMPAGAERNAETFHDPGKHNQKSHGHGRGTGKVTHGGRVSVPRGGYKIEHGPAGKPTKTVVYDKNNKPVRTVIHSAGLADGQSFAAADAIPDAPPDQQRRIDYQEGQGLEGATPWWGPVVVEGLWSGDGRQFAKGAVDWADLPLPLKWQPTEMPGHQGSVIVGRIDGLARRGSQIVGWGVFDDEGEYGAEALRLVQGAFLRGISLKADDVEAEDIELVWPAGADADGMPGMMLAATEETSSETFHLPGKHNQQDHGRPHRANPYKGPGVFLPHGVVGHNFSDQQEAPAIGLPTKLPPEPKELFHKGRIRSATLVAEAAFPECTIMLGAPPPDVMTAAAVSPHSTATSTGTWDGPGNEKRLPSPLSVEKARAAYAWIDDDAITDGELTKEHARFLHHEVGMDGNVGAANLTACSTGIAVLNGGRGGTNVPGPGKRGIWEHLAAHLRDADREPPPLEAATGPTTVVSAGWTMTIPDVWPDEWFDKPVEAPPFGALHITEQGRVFGYLGPDRVHHRAFRASGRQVTIPRGVDYSEFMNKPALVAGSDGHVYRINAGNITFDCGHPSPTDPRRADPGWAMQHYDNTCSIAARVRVGEDEHGTWVAGALLHGIQADAVERMMACALSGDWQNNKLNAALLVPVEGFPTAVEGSIRIREGAIVASSTPIRFARPPAEPDYSGTFELLAAAVGMDTASRFDQLAKAVGR